MKTTMQINICILYYVEIKCQLDEQIIFIADFIACSTCFGQYYIIAWNMLSMQ